MNLVAYDIVKGINRNATWIDPKYKKLYSREIKFRDYFGFSRNYNPDSNDYDIYLILSDVNPNDGSFVKVIDRYQPLKIPLNRIWNTIERYFENAINITVKAVEHNSDYDVYLLDL